MKVTSLLYHGTEAFTDIIDEFAMLRILSVIIRTKAKLTECSQKSLVDSLNGLLYSGTYNKIKDTNRLSDSCDLI